MIKKEQEDKTWSCIFKNSDLGSGFSAQAIKKALAICAVKFQEFSDRRVAVSSSPLFLSDMWHFLSSILTPLNREEVVEFALQVTLILIRDADGLLKFDFFLKEENSQEFLQIINKAGADFVLSNKKISDLLSDILPYFSVQDNLPDLFEFINLIVQDQLW